MDDNDFDCGYEYDEGSDIDNWETEQVFQDREGQDEPWPYEPSDAELDGMYEDRFDLGDE
jgi:hypothetical protein